jgi:luciferase family oxidoreductase group 1
MKALSTLPISVLDLAPVREGRSIAETFKSSQQLARHVEKLGAKRFWMAEHHGLEGVASAATSVLLCYIAQSTSTIRVGSGGIMLPNHAPLVIAEQFGTLESLFPGRIDLGLGRAPGGDQATMRALRRGLDREPDFAKQIMELESFLDKPEEGQRLKAIPGHGLKIPIWILGSSLYSAQLAAAMGLPYAFAGHFAPEVMLEAVELYRHRFEPGDIDKPRVMIGAQAIAADSDEEADFLATTLYQRFLGLIRNQRTTLQPPVRDMRALWSLGEEQALKSKLRYACIGGPARVKQKLLELVDLTGADELILNSEPYDDAARLRSFEIIFAARA